MYGKQFSLLATAGDLMQIDAALQSRSDVLLVDFDPKTGVFSPVLTSGMPPLPQYWSRVIARLPNPVLVPDWHGPTKAQVNIDVSDVIEYWRPVHLDGELLRGRLYYRRGRGDAPDKDFCRWADRTMAAVKRGLSYDARLLSYVGAEARTLIAEGKVKPY